MQFKLVFKHTYAKQFGDILCIYESDELYLQITKDRGDFYCCLLNKELNKRATIKDYTFDTAFPEVLEINVSNVVFNDTEIDSYIRQCINSRGLNVEFIKHAKPSANFAKLFFVLFLGTLVTLFIFKEIRVLLIIMDVFLFIFMFFFLIKHSKISMMNREIKYFSTLKNKNLLDNLYLLKKENQLKTFFKSVDYIEIEINKSLRPELTIYNHGNKNYFVIEINDEYIKYAVINNKIEEQDVPDKAFVTCANSLVSIGDIIALIDSIDINKPTFIK